MVNRLYKTSSNVKLNLLLGILLGFAWIAVANCGKTFALTNVNIGNISPLPGSADIYDDPSNAVPTAAPVSTNGWPSIENSISSGISYAEYTWQKVYVPLGQPATVSVQNGGGYCNNINDATDKGTTPEMIYQLYDLGPDETELTSLGTYFQSLNSLTGGPACRNISFPTINAGAGAASTIAGHQTYRVFYLIGHIVNCPSSNLSCAGDQVKAYRPYVMSGANTVYSFSSAGPLIGFARSLNAAVGSKPSAVAYSNLQSTTGARADWTWNYQYGAYCEEPTAATAIGWYDTDVGLLNPQFIDADLYNQTKSAIPPPWALDQHWLSTDIGTPGVNDSIKSTNYTISPLNRYMIQVNRVNWNNTVLILNPYDQFDSNNNVTCSDSTCTVTSNPVGPLALGQSYNVSVRMTNMGLSPWQPPDYYLKQVNTSFGAITYPLGSVVNSGESTVFNFTVSSGVPTSGNNYRYRMANTDGSFGATCGVNLAWGSSSPDLYPYLKVYNGDVSAGGAYRRTDGSCNSSDLVSPSNNGGNQFFGGIRTYALPDTGVGGSPKGSSTSFAAYALGLIDGQSPANGFPPYGFYSDAVNPTTALNKNYKDLNFANLDVLGGLMGGATPFAEAHCATNYFSSTQDSSIMTNNGAVASYSLDGKSGQQLFTPAYSLQIGGIVNGQLTMYINGDAYITGTIIYNPAGWGFDMSNFSNNAPYYALIAKGNIYIDPAVSRVDGFLVAQPRDDGTGGSISTCSPGGVAANNVQIAQVCTNRLVINGAVLAQRIQFARSFGNLNASTGNEATSYFTGSIPSQAAEIINSQPSLTVGQPNFSPPSASSSNKLGLPPIF
jgi:hypothetical protein